MQQVHDLYQRGCYQEVVQLINLKEFSAVSDPALAYVVSASYFQLGLYSESLSLLQDIESCFLADPSYLSLYGACLRRCGDLEAARTRLEQALSIQPDNASIRNNFANLLIDLDDYVQAESILSQLLADNPGYDDARVNMQRLKERQRIQQLQSSSTTPSHSPTWSLADPLMLAFSEDEVKRTRPKPVQSGQGVSDLKEKLPPLKQQQVAADQLSLAIKSVKEGRHNFALQLCSKVHQSMPHSASLYECVSDSYIALQRFADSEICLLHALQLGAKSFKIYANLTSLLCIRCDFALAQYYLEKASFLDENNPLLAKLRSQIASAQEASKVPMVRFDQQWSRPSMTLQES